MRSNPSARPSPRGGYSCYSVDTPRRERLPYPATLVAIVFFPRLFIKTSAGRHRRVRRAVWEPPGRTAPASPRRLSARPPPARHVVLPRPRSERRRESTIPGRRDDASCCQHAISGNAPYHTSIRPFFARGLQSVRIPHSLFPLGAEFTAVHSRFGRSRRRSGRPDAGSVKSQSSSLSDTDLQDTQEVSSSIGLDVRLGQTNLPHSSDE